MRILALLWRWWQTDAWMQGRGFVYFRWITNDRRNNISSQ